MSTVVVERSFREPVAMDELQAIEDRGRACLEMRAVRFLRSYFSRDRMRMICLYDAPDAESVRKAQTKVGLPFDRVWASRVVRHEAAQPDGDAIVLERTLPKPVDEAALRDGAARAAWCLEQYACRIAWSHLSGDGRRMICIFAGPDAESVRQSQRQAGMPFDRAWPATVHEPASPR